MRVALYARVSTADQTTDNQITELRAYAARAGWETVEYLDHAVSGSKESRPALDRMVADIRRRRVSVVCVWALDRLGRSLRHLVTLLDEWRALDVGIVSLREGIDATTAAGRLQLQILGALAEFERERMRERTRAGLDRARRAGVKLGRRPTELDPADLERTRALSVRLAARELGIAPSILQRARTAKVRN